MYHTLVAIVHACIVLSGWKLKKYGILSRPHRKFSFRPWLERWKVTFFRPVGGKVEILKNT
jgi:hypothetical protein